MSRDEDAVRVDAVGRLEVSDEGADEGHVVHVVLAGLRPPTAPPGVPDQPVGSVPRRSPVRIHHDEAVRFREAVEVGVLLELSARAQAAMERDQERHGVVGHGTRDVEVVGARGAVHVDSGIDPLAPRRGPRHG